MIEHLHFQFNNSFTVVFVLRFIKLKTLTKKGDEGLQAAKKIHGIHPIGIIGQ